MPENEKSLFRKSSLERVSSPDQLNEYIRVTNPSLIVILIGIFTILIAAAVWVFSGVIPKSVALSGVAVKDYDNNLKVYSYVSIADSKRLKEGMNVQISPTYAPREEYGYLSGKITFIGNNIVTTDYLNSKFENPQILIPILSSMKTENLVEVEMDVDGWSSSKAANIDVTEGSVCEISAVIGETKPYELIFNYK